MKASLVGALGLCPPGTVWTGKQAHLFTENRTGVTLGCPLPRSGCPAVMGHWL